MSWQKVGLIFAPNGSQWWARDYALLPTVEARADRLRVWYASVDEHRHGRIGYIETDSTDPSRIIASSSDPVIDIGTPGTFDDSGVNPSCVLHVAGRTYMYYIGWQRMERVPYALFAGLAISEDGERFEKVSATPVLDRTPDEPFVRSATSVLFENGTFRCWYVSAHAWTTVNGQAYPEYVIRYAESSDGIRWKPYQHECIPLTGSEFGIGRPWVVKSASGYQMWYSIRSRVEPYRIGYAESSDGLHWVRSDDRAGIVRSKEGWDSEMICYPCVFDAGGRRWMFYNGNRHGSTGFGLAQWIAEENTSDAR